MSIIKEIKSKTHKITSLKERGSILLKCSYSHQLSNNALHQRTQSGYIKRMNKQFLYSFLNYQSERVLNKIRIKTVFDKIPSVFNGVYDAKDD